MNDQVESRNDGQSGTEREFADIKSDLRMLKWMAGGNTALIIAVLGMLLLQLH